MKRPRASRRTMGASSGKGGGSGCEDAASLIGLPGSSVGCFLTLCVCEHLSEGFAASPAVARPARPEGSAAVGGGELPCAALDTGGA